MKVAVIGSGLSGLTAAALLAQAGHSVTVYEQHELIGGVTATLEREGFRWDWGQMMVPDLGPGEPGWNILNRLGVAGKINTLRAYRENYFPDFRIGRPREFEGPHWRREALKKQYPEDARGLERYYRLYERIHDLVSLNNQTGFSSRLRLLLKLLPVIRKKNWSARRLMEYYFSSEKLHAVFTAILADYVVSPDDFPGLIIPIINAESQYDERIPLEYKGHLPRSSWRFMINGWGELVAVLAYSLARSGGIIRKRAVVQNILIENRRVKGIVLDDGSRADADIVIASGGAREVFLRLIGREHLPEEYVRDHVENVSITESVFMVHLGVDYDPSVYQNGASLCYYYLTYDIKGCIEECKKNIYHEGKDGFLIYIPSVHSPSMAPPGHHAVTVYTIAPNNPIQGTWSEMKDQWAEKLLDYAEKHIPGLRAHEKIRVVLTPEDFKKRSHLDHHAFGGSIPRLDRTPPAHQTPIEGLYFVGAQSENFGGVVNAMTGASKAVDLVLKRNRAS